MICAECRQRASVSFLKTNPQSRYFSQFKRQRLQQAQDCVTSFRNPRCASERASTARSLSTAPTAAATAIEPDTRPKRSTSLTLSSVSAGTPLKGLNFLKSGTDPVAMHDDEYPKWLWSVLEPREKASKVQADTTATTKKQRTGKNKGIATTMSGPRVPIHEQTIDLPSGDGTLMGAVAARNARSKLTQAMRETRRARIKETNFLKAMG